jgi:hypothetical protein
MFARLLIVALFVWVAFPREPEHLVQEEAHG